MPESFANEPANALQFPQSDPAPIFELSRGNFATELLAAAVVHFQVFRHLAAGSLNFDDLRARTGLAERAGRVLFTALGAFGLVDVQMANRYSLTRLAREYLLPGSYFDISGYIALAGQSPGVADLVERLRSNQPARARTDDAGAAFIYREGMDSAMDQEQSARRLTLALAGRAKIVAPSLARVVPTESARLLLDLGGGTGIYAIAFLQKEPRLRAIIFDRPEVLKVAAEMAGQYGVSNRIELVAGDMFLDPLPPADTILLSNVLHDWDVPECRRLIQRCAGALQEAAQAGPAGRLLIHDVFLHDNLDGPLAIALYSAALFSLTEGRAYSAAEYRGWLAEAGLRAAAPVPTAVHCGVITASVNSGRT